MTNIFDMIQSRSAGIVRSSVARISALALAALASGGAWATAKPIAVWNADFVDGAERGGYVFNRNGNTVESDGTITIKSSSNGSSGGVTLLKSSHTARPMTVVAAFENLSIADSTHDIALATSKVLYNGTTTYFNRTGLSLQKSDSKFYGWWNNTTGDSAKGSIYTNSDATFRNAAFDSATRHYIAYCYTSGVYGYDNGNEVYYRSGLTSGSDSGLYGFAVGGLSNSADNNAENATVKYIAILNSNSSSDISAWSLTGMTAAETVANNGTITGGSNVGVNLLTEDMTVNLSSATSAAAVFVQTNATIVVTGSGSLNIGGGSGPLYIADGATLTIDASGLTLSADNPSVTLVSGKVFGTSLVSVTCPQLGGVDVATASVTENGITLSYTPGFSYKSGGTPSGWSTSWGGETFGTYYRPGPSASQPAVFEVKDGKHPYSDMSAKTSAFSYAVYADVSQMTSSKGVITAFGKKENMLVIYRDGSNVKAGRYQSTAFDSDWAAAVAMPSAGFHLYTVTYDPSTGVLHLYLDDGIVSSTNEGSSDLLCEHEDTAGNLASGFQIGSVHSGRGSTGFNVGIGMAFASAVGFDRVLSASDVAELSTVYPAMNGTISWNVTVPGTDTAYLTFTPGYSVSSSGVTLDGGSGTRTLVLPDSLALTAVTVENFNEIKIPADGTLTLNAGTTVALGTTIKGDGSSGTETIVLNDDFDFTGVTLQDIDAIQVAAGKALTLTAGAEDDVGGISLGDGAKLILVVASEDIYNYYGHISYMTLSKGDGATLEYGYMSSGVYTAINDPDAINGNNLLPYYYVFDVDDGASGGAVKTDVNWRGGSVPPSTGRNAAFHVDSDSAEGITVTVDADIAFGDIQVYGSGVITFVGSGGCKLSCANLDVASGVTVKIDGTSDSEALNVSGGTIVGDGTITVLSGAKMVLDGVTSANIFTVNGTLETSGTTTLSAANTVSSTGLIAVKSGTSTFASAMHGISGNIQVDTDATLKIGASYYNNSTTDYHYNNLNPSASSSIVVYGTLNLGQNRWQLGGNISITLHETAILTENPYGSAALDWIGSGTVTVDGNATIAARIRTATGVSPTFNISTGKTLSITSSFIAQSTGYEGSITKDGAGTLDLTAISPTKPITINAGKVVADEVPTATMDIGSSGTFTLKNRAWTSSPDVFTGTGTLELWADTTKTEHTVTGVTFGGKVIVKNTGNIQNNFKQSGAAMFSSEPEFRLDSTQTHLGGGYYDNEKSHPFVVKDLTGSGVFKSEWTSADEHSYVVKAVQTKDTVYDGTFTSSYSTSSKKRIMNLTVVGDGSGTVHSLTLSAAQNTSNTDVAQAESTLTVGDGAKVVFTSGGGWQYGKVIVDQGGWLESTNTATAVTQLRLYGGSNLVLPSTSHVLSGITNVTGSGEIKVHIADGSVPSVDDYLVSWSVSSAPSGNYLLAGASATTLALEADTSGLKVVACQATLTRANGEQLGYASLSDAVNAFVRLAFGGELDAYITISAGVEPTESQLSFWTATGIRYDSDNRKLYTAVVAQIGARQYPLLALAVEDAADNATVTLVSDSEEANVALNSKTIAFVEGDGATFSGSFSGTGTLVLDGAGLKLPASARWAAGWTGTVWLKNLSSYTLVPGNYGNADSVIKFTGVTAIIAADETFGPAVELEDDGATKALTLDCTTGYAANTVEFSEIRGTGTLVTSSSNGQYPRTNFKVLAWSDFAGSLDVDRGRVIFGTDTPSADTWRYVYVSSGAAVDVASGKTWKATEGFIVNGSLTCDGGELHGVAGDSPTLKLGGSGVVTNAFEGGGAQCFNAGAITVSDSLSVVLLGGWSNFGTWMLNGTSSLGFDPGTDNDIWLNSIITSAGQNTTVHIYGNGANKVVDNAQDGTKDAKIHVHNGGTFQVANAAADNDRLMYDEPGTVGGITVDAGGLIVFKSRETYTRNTTLNGGTFRLDGVNSSRSLDLFKTVEFTVTDNSTIEATGASHWIYLRGGTPTFNVSADKTLTMNAGFTYGGESQQNMIKAGAGTMVVNGYVDGGGAHESFSQPKGVTINAGTYELNAVQTSNGQTGDAANFYTVASGAKLKVGATGQVNAATLTLNDGSLLEFGASSTLINATTVSFASGTTTVSFSTGVTPTSGTKLIAWTTGPVGSFNTSVVIGGVTYYLNKESDGLYVYSAATYNGTDYDTVQAAIDAMTTAGGALSDITVNSADAVIPSGYALVTNTSTGAMTIRAAGGDIYWTRGTYWAASYAGGDSPAVFTTTREGGSVTPYAGGDTVVIPDGTLRFYGAITAGKTMKFDYAGTVPVSYTTAISASLKGSTIVITDGTTVEFQNASWNPSLTPIIYGCTIAHAGTGKIAVANNVTLTVNNSSSITAPIVLSGSGSSLVVESGSTTPTPTTSVAGAFVQSSIDGSGTITYTVADIVATVGGTPYASLVDAIAAASDGATVTLVRNSSEAVTLNKDITITGAGVWSGTLSGTGTLTLDPDSTTLTTSMTISGSNTLRIEDALTITGSITVGGDATLSFAEGASLTLSGDLTAASGLTVAPDAISAASATLVTANAVPANVALVDPDEDGWTYRLVGTSTTIAITRTTTPVLALRYNAVPGVSPESPEGGWGVSSWNNGFDSSSSLRVGPNATLPVVYEVTSSKTPYHKIDGTKVTPFTFAVYVDISQVPATEKRVIASYGNGYHENTHSVLLYRNGATINAAYVKKNGNIDCSASITLDEAGLHGFHLYTVVCELSGETQSITLYKDDDAVNTGYAASTITMGTNSGPCIGSVFNGLQTGFYTGINTAIATFLGYDMALNAGDVADLAVEYPATDGTVIPGTVDNRTSDSAIGGSVITVYDTMTGTGSLYLGVSGAGTLNIPSGANISVPHMRVQNTNSGNVTVNIDGVVNVTSTSTTYNVQSEMGQYKGILFGNKSGAGTGTYNIGASGVLNATNAWLQTVYQAGEQTVNIDGGTVAVKGLYAAKDNSTVNVTNGGTLEVSESPTGSAITYNFAEGTYRITGGDTTVSTPIRFSGTSSAPTTIDPYGNEITMTAESLNGNGYIIAADSSAAGDGKVIFPASTPNFSGYVVLNDDNGANIDISGYKGKVLLDGTNTTTIASLVGFRGTVVILKPGTYHARGVDLTNLAIQVGSYEGLETGIILEADAGLEGKVTIISGACNLYVNNNTFLYEGHIFNGGVSPFGTLTYCHSQEGTVSEIHYYPGDALTDPELAVVRPVPATIWNLLPYYKIFVGDPSVVTAGKYYGSTDNPAHWNSGVVQADGNVAFKVEAGKTLVVDVSTNAVFNEVQIITYAPVGQPAPSAVNRGTLVFRSESGDKSITVTNGLYSASMYVDTEIESGFTFSAENNAGIHVMQFSTAIVNCGTEADRYEVPYLGGAGEVIVSNDCYVAFDKAELYNLTVNGDVVVENNLATVDNRSTFRVSQNLTVNRNGVMTMRDSSCQAAVLFITVNDGGLFECEGSHITAYRLITHGAGVAEFDSNSQLELVYEYSDYAKATGDGTVRFIGKLPDGTWWTNALDNASNGWRGTVAIKDWDSSGSSWWTPANYGNQYSTLEADNCNVYYFAGSGNTALPTLKLAGNLTINNGSSGVVNNFAGLTGPGTLEIKQGGGATQTLRFATGSDFTGSITNANFKLVFGTSGGEASTITVNSGVTAGLGNGATWKSGNIKINGTLDVKGTGTLEGSVAAFNGSQVNLATPVPLTVNGTFALPEASGTMTVNPAWEINDTDATGVSVIAGITDSESLTAGMILTNVTVYGAADASLVVAKTNEVNTALRDIAVYKRLPVSGGGATDVKVPISWMKSNAATDLAGQTTIAGYETVIRDTRSANGCKYIESYALGLTPSDSNSVPAAGMSVNGENFEIFLSNAVVPEGVTLTLRAGTTTPSSEEGEDYVEDGAGDDITATITGNGTAEPARAARVVIPIPSYDPEDPEADPVNLYRLKVGISGTVTTP